MIGTVGTNLILNPILLSAQAEFFRRELYHEHTEEALALIPAEAGVATVNRFGPHLSNRRVLVPLGYPPPFRLDHVTTADYVLLDLVDCRTVPAVEKRARYAEMVRDILETSDYRVAYWEERILLLERGDPLEERPAEVLDYVDTLVEQDRPCWP